MSDEGEPSHKQKKRKKVKKIKKASLHDTKSLNAEQNSSEVQCDGDTNDTDQDAGAQVFTEPKIVPSPNNVSKQRRHSRRKSSGNKGRNMYPQTVITAVLEELSDDMIDEPPRIDGGDGAAVEIIAQTPVSLQPDKVYVERKNGFATTPRAKLFNSLSNVEEGLANGSYSKSVATPLELAIFIQKCCRPIYTLCHGMLGGMAVLHLILVYGTGDHFSEDKNFTLMYSTYARVYQSIFHILSILCFISIMDRCDIKHMDISQVAERFRFQFSTVLVLPVYFIMLILTFVTTKWDDWLALASDDSWDSNNLTVWRNLNLCRDIGAILGWILVALFPAEDMLHLHLRQMMKYQHTSAQAPSRY